MIPPNLFTCSYTFFHLISVLTNMDIGDHVDIKGSTSLLWACIFGLFYFFPRIGSFDLFITNIYWNWLI
jgi:hypothetical protein